MAKKKASGQNYQSRIRGFFNKFKKRNLKLFILPLTLFLILLIFSITLFEFLFQDKFFPRIYLGDTHLVYLTPSQAQAVIEANFESRANQKLDFEYQDKKYQIDLSTSSAQINSQTSLAEAFSLGHSGNFWQKITSQLKTLIFGRYLEAEINLSADKQINPISENVKKTPINASVEVENLASSSAKIKITDSQNGLSLDENKLKQEIKHYLLYGSFNSSLPIIEVEPDITTSEAQAAKSTLEEVSQNPIKLTYQNQNWTLDAPTVFALLNFNSQSQNPLDDKKLADFLKKQVTPSIDQPVIEGQFSFDPGNQRVNAFKAAQNGQTLDIVKTEELINLALQGQRPKNITLPVKVVEPKIKTSDVNDLGIKELLGRGVSNFAGSIPNRIYNVGLTAQKINGTLIPPGETFSFNNTVGDISAATGFKQAYVIKNGRTVLDDGGGVCQDSTTLFRAVLNAGLPVVSRTAHAYRVGYYEQGFPPGLDATVFYPSVDFQFKNDTQNYVLIQAYTSGVTLTVDLYGTSDGRVATLSKPVISSQTPPPPELRQDDPTLPAGVVKQVDFSAWGANVSFNRTVVRGGEVIINENFRSSYRPWQAVFLVGTGG